MGENARKRNPDPERIAEILAARGAKAACPVCDVNDWYPFGRIGNTLVGLPAVSADEEFLRGGGVENTFVCYAMGCKNCGFVRLHMANTIDREGDDQP